MSKEEAQTSLDGTSNGKVKADGKLPSKKEVKAELKTEVKKAEQNKKTDHNNSKDSSKNGISVRSSQAQPNQDKTASKAAPAHRSERMNQLHEAPRPNLNQQKPKQKQPNQAQKQKQHQQVIQPSPRPNERTDDNRYKPKNPPSGAKKTRIVDTRTSTVDLSKYDEKLDRIADAANGK